MFLVNDYIHTISFGMDLLITHVISQLVTWLMK
jgi:hypothetical protein